MTKREKHAKELYESGLKLMWQDDFDGALAFYNQAQTIAESEELRELITIRKAEVLIATDQPGDEIAMLPQIVMRRRSLRHVYMAATVLMRRYVELEDRRRGIFYGEIGRKAADELGDPMARASVLNGLGIALAANSDFTASLDALEEAYDALSLLDENREDVRSLRPAILINIGGVKVVDGATIEGVRTLEQALPFVNEDYVIAEAMLDLCLGYSDLEDYEAAEAFGRRALELAIVPRQVRNGNHLLARVALQTGRVEEASRRFDIVASFYPEFDNVKELLMAVDLRAVVNWKA